MTLRVTPWGKDDFKATSEEAESKDWAYWQNRLNRASLVMLAEEGIIDKNIVPRIAAAQNTQKIFKICRALLASQTSCRWKKC